MVHGNGQYPVTLRSTGTLLLRSVPQDCIRMHILNWIRVGNKYHQSCRLNYKASASWKQNGGQAILMCFKQPIFMTSVWRAGHSRLPSSWGATHMSGRALGNGCHTQGTSLGCWTEQTSKAAVNDRDKCWHLSRYKRTHHILTLQSSCVLGLSSL